MREYLHQNRQYFESIDVETYQAMREFMHSERVMKDMKNSRKGTRINMCKALEDIYEDGKTEGKEMGKLTLIANMLRNGMSAEDIKKYAGVTDEMIAEAGFILYYPRLKKEQLLFIRLSISSPDGAVLSRRPVAERGRRDNTAPSGRTPESE